VVKKPANIAYTNDKNVACLISLFGLKVLTAVDVIYEQRERVFQRDIQGRFPFEQKTQFAVPECPVAKWNATT
jgi:hypothetical protein